MESELLFAELDREHGFEPLTIAGKLPEDLIGTHYHAGTGSYGVLGDRVHHPFDGDGAVLALRLTGDGVEAGLRFVDTAGRRRELAAGRRLFGGYGTPLRNPFSELILSRFKNPANTGILNAGGRLFALCEAGLPEEIDPGTLTTLGPCDFQGAVTRAYTAHPKRVPGRASTIGFGLVLGPRAALELYEMDRDGTTRRLRRVPVPGTLLLHDHAVTTRHAIFILAPLVPRLGQILLRRSGLASALDLEPTRPTRVLVVPFDVAEEPFEVPMAACYVEHLANAFSDGDVIEVDVTRYESLASLQRFIAGGLVGGLGSLDNALVRLRIDTRRRVVSEEVLASGQELPVFDPREATTRHRALFTVGFSTPERNGQGLWDAVVRHDLVRGDTTSYVPGSGHLVSEPQIVPRPDGGTWALVVVRDLQGRRSRLEILDAERLSDGPIATATASELWPFLIHGAFHKAG